MSKPDPGGHDPVENPVLAKVRTADEAGARPGSLAANSRDGLTPNVRLFPPRASPTRIADPDDDQQPAPDDRSADSEEEQPREPQNLAEDRDEHPESEEDADQGDGAYQEEAPGDVDERTSHRESVFLCHRTGA